MIIVTGNKNKQKEISKFVKNCKFKDIDLQEVDANNPITIILHKAKDAKEIVNDDVIVEDITMYVNNRFVPDIKWKQNELKEGDRVEIILSVAKTDGNKIKVYQKSLKGIVHLDKCNKYDFGFDNIVFINGKVCLGDYKKEKPLRDFYKEIVGDMLKTDYVYDIKNIKEWKGKYQNT